MKEYIYALACLDITGGSIYRALHLAKALSIIIGKEQWVYAIRKYRWPR